MSRCSPSLVLWSRSLGSSGSRLSPGGFSSGNSPRSVRILRVFSSHSRVPATVVDVECAATPFSTSSKVRTKAPPPRRPRDGSRYWIILEPPSPVHRDRLHRNDETQQKPPPPRKPERRSDEEEFRCGTKSRASSSSVSVVASPKNVVWEEDPCNDKNGDGQIATGGGHLLGGAPHRPAVNADSRSEKSSNRIATVTFQSGTSADESRRSSRRSMTLEGWNDTIVPGWDRIPYPLGFSCQKRDRATKVDGWYRQTDQVLAAAMTPPTMERVLPLRRLLGEEQQQQQHVTTTATAGTISASSAVSAQTLKWVLQGWRTKFLGDDDDDDEGKTTTNSSPKQVQKRFSRYTTSRFSTPNHTPRPGHTYTNRTVQSRIVPGWNAAHATDRCFHVPRPTAAVTHPEAVVQARPGQLPPPRTAHDRRRAEPTTQRNRRWTGMVVSPTAVVVANATPVRPTADATTTTTTGRIADEEFEQRVWQTTPGSVDRTFQLVDQWLRLQTNEPLLSAPTVAVAALDWVVECWQNTIRNHHHNPNGGTESIASPEEVYERVMRIARATEADVTSSGPTLSRIIQTIGQIEEPAKAPRRAEALVQRYLDEANKSGSDTQYCLNTTTVNSLLHLWYRSRLPESPATADRWLQQLLREGHQSKNSKQRPDRAKPDDVTYATVIATWTAVAAPGAAVHRAEILMRAITMEQQGEEGGPLGFMVIGTVIDALAKAGHVERAHKLLNSYTAAAPHLVRRPVELLEGCHPVLSILEAYRKRLDRQPAVVLAQMETFIHQMEILANKHEALNRVFHPDAACYNIIIGAYTQLRMPQRAESLLKRIMLMHESNGYDFLVPSDSLQPSLTTVWNGVLEAWAESGDAEAVPRAVALVKSMETRCTNDPSFRPSSQTYNLLLHCLVHDRRNSLVENAREAQELLERMEKEEAGIMSKPNDISYNTVLRAWCTAGYPDHAESLLHRMCLQHSPVGEAENGISPSALPTSLQFVNVMHGWASIARRKNGHHRALERVEQLLQTMHILHERGFRTKPSLTAYNIFLECLIKSRESDAPERAESFLRLMEETGETDNSLKPDAVIFNSVLTSWLRSNRSDAPERATALFERMKMLHMEAANVINTHTYMTLMAIYAQHTLAAKAQKVFDEMVNLNDSKVPFAAYITLLHAWAIAGKPEIAFQILEQLRQEFEAGKLEGPSKRSTLAFNAVLTSWLNSKRPDAAEKTESCLETMHSLVASGKFDVRPDLLSYSSVIKSFLLCSHPDAAHRAMRIFETMKALYMESGDHSICPDLKIYMDVIAVLAKSSQHSDVTSDDTSLSASEQIHQLLDEMDSFVHPSCWHDQGELVFSRIAWQVTESDFTTKEKVQLMLQLCLLADQHSVKVDRTIMMLFDQYRRLETI